MHLILSAMQPHNVLLRRAGAAGSALALMLPASAAPRALPLHHNVPRASQARFVMRVPTAADLYGRSLNADDYFSYRGRQITTNWRSGQSAAVIVSHRAPNLHRLDYVSPESLQGRKSLSDGRQEWRYDPRRRLVYHLRLDPNADAVADAAAAYTLLKANYNVAVIPQKQIWANRKVFLLTIQRRSNHLPVRKLWIDAATGLVLKRESYRAISEGGRVAAKLSVTVAFTEISFRPHLTRAAFDHVRLARPGTPVSEEKAGAENPIPLASVSRQLGGAWLTPPSLAGYRLVSAAVTNGPRPRLHLRYSDGLNLVSLFELRRTTTHLPTRVPHSRPLQVGRLSGRVVHRASLTAINWDSSVFNLTLMGEIAQKTLLQLAAAVGDHHP